MGKEIFGKLTSEAFKHDMIETATGVGMLVMTIALVAYLFYSRRWKWLWKEWLTTVDPKKIGVMYLIVALLMLFKGVVDAGMMRAQQALAVGEAHGYLTAPHFQQLFTAHGTTMIFFVGMGVVFGMMNLVIPLQIGARDVAYPFLNALSFWLFFSGSMFILVSLVVGNFSAAGWVAYPPLSGLKYSPDVGVDYWIWSVQIAGVGSLLSGLNFLVTIFKMRCPGMTFMRMPLYVWSALGTLFLVVFAFPILTATATLLALDRLMGMHFFTADLGGNPMMYINLIWAWGHPEVYILALPAFGIFSEVVSTFSQKRLFGYATMVWAIIVIAFLSFIVWLHHFFTMGAGANVNAFFGIMTMLIAIPTGVKIFNWLFTSYRGRIQFTSPMLYFLGFVVIFTTGGLTGMLMSIPPVDFQVHNSLFLIAHFHSMLLPSLLFGFFAGFTYWFPKIMGFKLNEKWGHYACWLWSVGFLFAFMPLYMLGFMGATRRLDHYESGFGWQPLFIVASFGALLILSGMTCQAIQLIVSIKERKQNRDTTGDPWNGRTLEWATSSPAPIYNFATLPVVEGRDAFWTMKQGKNQPKPIYEDIHLPKNTPMPIVIGALSFFFGFALVWHIMWLAALSFVAIVIALIIRLSSPDEEDTITAAEVAKIEKEAHGSR